MKQRRKKQTWKPEQVRLVKAIMALAFLLLIVVAYLAILSLAEKHADAQESEKGAIYPLKQFERMFSTNYKRIPRNVACLPVEKRPDQTLSPYFFVNSENSETDRLPLKSTSAEVTISGVIAEIIITQTYTNSGDNPLEATYVFPASTKASVFAMRMTIGERVIDAEIKEKIEARKIYDDAVKKGQTASLLEQKRPNVFQMKVGNILPKDEIVVELKYVEHIVPENKTYEFVFPTVVGPRYSNSNDEESHGWIKNPYLHEKQDAPYSFDFTLKLNSGLPISQISSPSHDLLVDYEENNVAHVFLDDANNPGNRDVVFRYNLAGKKIESGLMLYEGEDANYFLMMMEPPKRVKADEIVPREYIFIVDVSGSMNGFPLDVSKNLMRNLLSSLNPSDRINIMLFASSNQVLAPQSLPVTESNIEKALTFINNSRGGGGTELIPALKSAMKLPRTEGMSRIAIVVTDGYVGVEKDAFEVIGKNLNHTNVFSFGIGSSVNRFIIEGMARAGHGEPFVVLNHKEAPNTAQKFQKYISSPILQGIEVKFDGIEAYDVEPLSMPDMFADRPLVLFGKYRGEAEGSIKITGHTADNRFQRELEFEQALVSEEHKAIRYLWARQKISRLADMHKLSPHDERVQEITNIGLSFNLLTDYTSFVAVDKEVRSDGRVVKVKQPLPMPQGVSDMAVGEPVSMESRANRRMLKRSASTGSYGKGKIGVGMGGAGLGIPSSRAIMAEEKEEAIDKTVGSVRKQETKRTPGRISLTIGLKDLQQRKNARKLMAKQMTDVLATYKQELTKSPKLSGVIKVKIVVDAKGKIKSVSITSDTLKHQTIAALLLKRLRSLAKLPHNNNDSEFTVTFVFRKS